MRMPMLSRLSLIAGLTLLSLAAGAQAQTSRPSPVAVSDDNVTITGSTNRYGAMPTDPVGDFARRVMAACGDIPGQPRVTPEAQRKSGVACGMLIYGLDGKSPKEYTPYPMFWIVGVDGDPKDPNVYIVGAKGEFRMRHKRASELLTFSSTTVFNGTASPISGPVASGGGDTFKYSYRTILWPGYCANAKVIATQGCGEGYTDRVFNFRDYVAAWDRRHRREFEPTAPRD